MYEDVRILLSELTILAWNLNEALLEIRARTDTPFDEVNPYPWDEDKHLSRTQRVEETLDDAIELLPQWLSNHLIGIDLTEIWPTLFSLCREITVYIGGSAILGGFIPDELCTKPNALTDAGAKTAVGDRITALLEHPSLRV
jgi:hypothetical protein